jgi:hypothetical protein
MGVDKTAAAWVLSVYDWPAVNPAGFLCGFGRSHDRCLRVLEWRRSKGDVVAGEKGTLATWIPVALGVLSLVFGGGWFKTYVEYGQMVQRENQRLLTEYLAPMEVLLNDNDEIFNRIYKNYREGNWGVLESYVVKVRDQPDSSDLPLMRRDIVTLALNNKEIMVLIKGYAGEARDEEYLRESQKFRRHAQNWINRWAATEEVIRTGDQLPYAEPFPDAFPSALQREIRLRETQ